MRVLVTGGTGYIGSHAAVALIEAGHEAVLLDNQHNSTGAVASRIGRITRTSPELIRGDVRDASMLAELFSARRIDAVMHFAGLKAVGESVQRPLDYYETNVGGTIRLCQAMEAAGVRKLIFSSSATVYGDPDRVPIREDAPTGGTTNPYGTSKHMVERMLTDLSTANPGWCIGILRYFNPVGAHKSALIGESPSGIPNNLVPYIAQVAAGEREHLQVFGDDYPTRDGTGVRDYIHVVDLAAGHVRALEYLDAQPGQHAWNLGRGEGHSVLEAVRAFEQASGCSIPYRVTERRPGDVAECWADPSKAERELGWRAERGLATMMEDAWRWQRQGSDTETAS
ncbi:UDP-glucose 4-epimerase GalE [Halorhodospira halophila]|uniref:UDP-glucose 4-epimerase n=1 Tax=Halorhodospira halophila (strain DSM 244 / SL1) TaxID=349124 RepID=A1WX92_HALHL|nr:UDP-glucose 4-epimerase GalE [Halorhodospira halophila]ABM62304.1 UDP-galactose 4-epimerase [Halorhodospira halophila SL1]MBK1729279.1 UDP-glucose 4-epimerase GalE [Halorhodospira halophila]